MGKVEGEEMSTIYAPSGKAGEYSPLALNVYRGCDHGCFYCYVPAMVGRFEQYNHSEVQDKSGFVHQLAKDAKGFANSKRQVLLSFTTDPYCRMNDKYKRTRECLEILNENNIPVAILTKGGNRCLQDMDIFKAFGENIKVGVSLTFDNDGDSLQNESGAASTSERISVLKILHDERIKTWVSIEPVLDHKQSIHLIEMSMPFVDHYKVGKVNHRPEIEGRIDWHKFLVDAVTLLRTDGVKFYVKNDLRAFANGFELTVEESDPRYLFLNNSRIVSGSLFTTQEEMEW